MKEKDVGMLREALPYLHEFTGQTFVIKLGGELVDHENLKVLAEEIAFVSKLSLDLVVVHGGGAQADALQKKLGYETVRVSGRRLTDENTLDVAKMVFRGKVNMELVANLQSVGVQAVGLSGLDAGLIQAKRRPPQKVKDPETGKKVEIDYGHVGDVTGVNPAILRSLIGARFVPVVCSLGADEKGNVLNINADTIATEIAIAMKAHKLIVLTNVPGVLEDVKNHESRISALTAEKAQALIESGTIAGGMIPKIENALKACKGGVPRVHIVDGTVPDNLLRELFTKEGSGTMIARTEEIDTWKSEGWMIV
ncbi:MAG: acetylglutamate kinase [Planctomycetes bacterium]|nr:acetylglutamate kinase [Planctomycetota bacterium]